MELPDMSKRLLDLTNLSIGTCLVAFLYLPSLVLAMLVGRHGDLTPGPGSAPAARVHARTVREHEAQAATARITTER